MRLKIEFSCDNADFDGESLSAEVARVLRQAGVEFSELLETASVGVPVRDEARLRDTNGNTIGSLSVEW